jgi:hypothetical protein
VTKIATYLISTGITCSTSTLIGPTGTTISTGVLTSTITATYCTTRGPQVQNSRRSTGLQYSSRIVPYLTAASASRSFAKASVSLSGRGFDCDGGLVGGCGQWQAHEARAQGFCVCRHEKGNTQTHVRVCGNSSVTSHGCNHETELSVLVPFESRRDVRIGQSVFFCRVCTWWQSLFLIRAVTPKWIQIPHYSHAPHECRGEGAPKMLPRAYKIYSFWQ